MFNIMLRNCTNQVFEDMKLRSWNWINAKYKKAGWSFYRCHAEPGLCLQDLF